MTSLSPYMPYHMKWASKDKTTLIVSMQLHYLSPKALQDQELLVQVDSLELEPFAASRKVQLCLAINTKESEKIEYTLLEEKKNMAFHL